MDFYISLLRKHGFGDMKYLHYLLLFGSLSIHIILFAINKMTGFNQYILLTVAIILQLVLIVWVRVKYPEFTFLGY